MPPSSPFACDPAQSRGRLIPEPESAQRTPFQRDRDRLIHSQAFRRLKHKTQVFVSPDGDHFRTRLTHSLEVSQIARSIARALGLDEDLTEALSLAHDLGHTAFGHAGEAALDACMASTGGFDHNAQTLRVVTLLEQPYPAFDGLNLTWETLEGLVKHNGPVTGDLPFGVAAYVAGHNLELASYPSAEAQVAALADDIAYDNHDVEDGLRAGLFALDDVLSVPIMARHFAAAQRDFPAVPAQRLVRETIRRSIGDMVADVLAETIQRLAALPQQSAEAVRAADKPVVAFSPGMEAQERALKQFLWTRMYQHPRVLEATDAAKTVVTALFPAYLGEPARLPSRWGGDIYQGLPPARRVADFIAGMTDRYAIRAYADLFGAPPKALDRP
jgi:dGTPase